MRIYIRTHDTIIRRRAIFSIILSSIAIAAIIIEIGFHDSILPKSAISAWWISTVALMVSYYPVGLDDLLAIKTDNHLRALFIIGGIVNAILIMKKVGIFISPLVPILIISGMWISVDIYIFILFQVRKREKRRKNVIHREKRRDGYIKK